MFLITLHSDACAFGLSYNVWLYVSLHRKRLLVDGFSNHNSLMSCFSWVLSFNCQFCCCTKNVVWRNFESCLPILGGHWPCYMYVSLQTVVWDCTRWLLLEVFMCKEVAIFMQTSIPTHCNLLQIIPNILQAQESQNHSPS